MSFNCQDRFPEPAAQAPGRQARRARRRFFPVFARRGAAVGVLLAGLLAPAAVAEEGFVSLMPKKDIREQWTIEVAPPSTWELKDGMIYCLGKPNGFLRSKKIYKNFIFRADWRFVKEGWTEKPPEWPNAGFFINAQEVVDGWPKSLEVQGHYGEAASVFGVRGGKVTGAKRGEIVKNRVPFGDWDHVEVHSEGGHVTVFLNGEKVNEGSDLYPTEGNVCLQSEGWPLWYRNVEIKDLGK
jgi:3-keto-disaccharide hydrolase